MRIAEGDTIVTPDGAKVGTVHRVVLDPKTGDVTDIVVSKGILFKEERVVAVDMLADKDNGALRLQTEVDPKTLPPFEEAHVVPFYDRSRPQYPDYTNPLLWYPHAGFEVGNVDVAKTTVERTVPDDSTALKVGASIFGRDDEKIGKVAEVVVDPTGRLAGIVASSGLPATDRKFLPASWVQYWGEEEVYLAVGTGTIEKLPQN